MTGPSGIVQHVTRLAPSPTGALHLGNARTFLVNYLLARTRGWRILLRMEDLDGPRVKPGAANEALTDLAWLGLEWDSRTADQSHRGEAYRAALDSLVAMGRAYPCTCSRTDIALAASAPHRDDGIAAYPGTCRGQWASAEQAAASVGRPAAFRLEVRDAVYEFEDMVAGSQRVALAECGGDFVIFKADGQAAYQLAVVVDDAEAAVTEIVRGDDLLDSTGRQMLLQDLLGLPRPRYWHLPLVVGPDGRRLAKRHGDTRLAHYRAHGVTAHRVLGLLGYWCGLLEARRPCEMAELLEQFSIDRLPDGPVVFGPDDEAYLAGQHSST